MGIFSRRRSYSSSDTMSHNNYNNTSTNYTGGNTGMNTAGNYGHHDQQYSNNPNMSHHSSGNPLSGTTHTGGHHNNLTHNSNDLNYQNEQYSRNHGDLSRHNSTHALGNTHHNTSGPLNGNRHNGPGPNTMTGQHNGYGPNSGPMHSGGGHHNHNDNYRGDYNDKHNSRHFDDDRHHNRRGGGGRGRGFALFGGSGGGGKMRKSHNRDKTRSRSRRIRNRYDPDSGVFNARPSFGQWLKHTWLDILTMAAMGAIGLGVYEADPAPSRSFPITNLDGSVVYPTVAYPLRNEIIPIWAAALMAALIPIFIILCMQIRIKSFWDVNNGVLGLLYSLIAAAVFQVFVKWLIGGLRPHFLAVCDPDPSIAAQAEGNGNGFAGLMFDRSICRGDRNQINDALESMPSGHSTAAFAGFVYLSLYLNAKLKVWSNFHPSFWKLIVTYAPILGACLIAGSLTIDEYHNWYDCLAGAIIGTFFAFSAYRMVYASVFDFRFNHIPLTREVPFGFGAGSAGAGGFESAVFTHKAGWGYDEAFGGAPFDAGYGLRGQVSGFDTAREVAGNKHGHHKHDDVEHNAGLGHNRGHHDGVGAVGHTTGANHRDGISHNNNMTGHHGTGIGNTTTTGHHDGIGHHNNTGTGFRHGTIGTGIGQTTNTGTGTGLGHNTTGTTLGHNNTSTGLGHNTTGTGSGFGHNTTNTGTGIGHNTTGTGLDHDTGTTRGGENVLGDIHERGRTTDYNPGNTHNTTSGIGHHNQGGVDNSALPGGHYDHTTKQGGDWGYPEGTTDNDGRVTPNRYRQHRKSLERKAIPM